MGPPTRPRPPGRPQSITDRLRNLGTGTVAAILGILFLTGLVVTVAQLRGGEDSAEPTGGDGATNSTQSTPSLPLSLTDVGFDSGTIDPTDSSEGPEATSYCNNSPASAGLVDWRGNRLTEADGQRRVAQFVAQFESSVHATAFLAESSQLIDCESWRTGSSGNEVLFTVAEATPDQVFGDETRQFDLRASSDGPELFLRTLLVRSGRDVAQFTFVSADRQDMSRLNDLTALATVELGF